MYPYVKFKNIYFNFSPHLAHLVYSLCHFHWAPMKNKGCSLSGPLTLKAKSSEKFSQSKNVQNYDILGALKIRGMKSSEFYCKRHIFAWIHVVWAKVGWGVWPLGLWGKSQKVTRGSHINDVSPLTQGLRYRTACDSQSINRKVFRWPRSFDSRPWLLCSNAYSACHPSGVG